jgi:hypothetical protein
MGTSINLIAGPFSPSSLSKDMLIDVEQAMLSNYCDCVLVERDKETGKYCVTMVTLLETE